MAGVSSPAPAAAGTALASPPSLRAHPADLAALAGLALVGLVAALTFRQYGLSWDDYTHAQYGDLLLSLYGTGFRDDRALSFVNLYMYGGGFDMLAALLAKILPFDIFATRRLLGAAVGVIGLVAAWRIARRLGGPVAGLAALVLLATCPLYYGHMFMNPKDAPFAVEMTVLLLALVRANDEYPKPSAETVILLGLAVGIAFGTRILAGLTVVYALGAWAVMLGLDARTAGLRPAAARLGAFVAALLPALLLAYLVMGLVWPWSILHPANPIFAVEYFSHFFEKPWRELFGGSLILVPDMPWTYLPTLLALKLPELFLALALVGLGRGLVVALRGDMPAPRRANAAMLVLAAAGPLAVAMITRPAMYNGVRHFIFVIPPMAVLGGVATAWIWQWLGGRGPAWRAAGAAAFAVGLAVPVIEMARLHPYEYTHFNRLSGGIRNADERYMLDYWGLSFKQAAEQLLETLAQRQEKPPAGRPWKIAVCGPHPPARVALGPDFEPTWDSNGADFALMLGEFYCADLDAPVLAEVQREGVVYARAYDIRGRSIRSVLRYPPP
jgi:hypothetical protein